MASFKKFTELDHDLELEENEEEETEIEEDELESTITKTKTPKDRSSYGRRKPKDLDFLECKSDLAHLLYLNQKVQVTVRHSLFPNLNLTQHQLPSSTELEKYNFPHSTLVNPRPVYFAKKHCDILDKCFRRTLARDHYRKRLSFARTKYQNTSQSNRKVRKLVKEEAYHPSLFTFAERLECDPDPFFYGSYDFYYTAGNICVLGGKYGNVLHVDGKELNTIKSSIFPSGDDLSTTKLKELNSMQLSTESEIFQLSPLNDINNLHNLVGARQLNNMRIMSVQPESGEMKLLTEFKTKSTPFISFAQSNECPELLAITNMNQHVRLYNIKDKNITIQNLYKMQDVNSQYNGISWNCIKPWENQTFLYANDRHLCAIDFRSPQEEWIKTRCTFSTKEFPCEFISSLASSSFDNIFYMGTNHKIRCFDMRYLGQHKHFENFTLCEWTHQLDHPAVFLDTYQRKNREIIACASPLAGDLRICELSRSKLLEEVESDDHCNDSKYIYKSYCLPWLPPTLQEAYESACIAGKALQPEANLRQRIRCCTTGLTFFNSSDPKKVQALLLQANSNGDIYAQNMYKRKSHIQKPKMNERNDEIMADYATEVAKLPQPDLNHTDIVNMSAMQKVLLCPALNSTPEDPERDISDEEAKEKPQLKYRFKGRWQKSMSTLCKFKDALAQDLLSIWDIPYEEELDIKLSTLKKKFKKEKDSKDVLNWLHSSEVQAPTIKIPVANLSVTNMEIDTEELHALPGESMLNDTIETYVSSINRPGEESLQNRTFTSTKSKTAKPKKKHVKGF